MKVVVIGGTGLIGSKVVEKLNAHGHDASPAAPQTGCNTITNEGVTEAVAGAEVLIDVSNSPSFADDDVMNFFVTSTNNLIAAAREAGVKHYVALSIVGDDRLPDSGYLRAKVAQEKLIVESGIPYTIVRATQFFEFSTAIANSSMIDGKAHLSTAYYQPMASDDVATAVGRAAAGEPVNGIAETGGPEKVRMSEFIAAALARTGDEREIVADPSAKYFGTVLKDDDLVPGPDAVLGTTSYEEWLAGSGR
ncbi:SDR family oxidoreductase [Isoptericola sp. NEAU-Y5]|uniref:SDR family oxidoreductase n=1 Tax=Isoptericola luteus TaxID=2879484 RepID=A0ABS7ZEY5_9MICO|nr:SDR family oxidoreductase [Isoptericola sp. NEAU-Y5]MCA5893594.1 SDR family oxidoreductase [Isoptericola sp. NEAU-Y5]